MARDKSSAAKYSVGKGKRLERRVANLLSEFLGTKIRRSPNSGGFNKSYKTKVGEREFISDLMCEEKLNFAIEVKSERGFSFDALLANPTKCKFSKWWSQVCYDARSVNILPLLWFKPSVNADWICLNRDGMEALCLLHRVNVILVDFEDTTIGQLYFIRWDDFKSKVDKSLMFDKTE